MLAFLTSKMEPGTVQGKEPEAKSWYDILFTVRFDSRRKDPTSRILSYGNWDGDGLSLVILSKLFWRECGAFMHRIMQCI